MKKKRILALFLAAVSCLSLAVSASAAGTTTRKATDFKDYDRSAWYAEAVSAAVDNGLKPRFTAVSPATTVLYRIGMTAKHRNLRIERPII